MKGDSKIMVKGRNIYTSILKIYGYSKYAYLALFNKHYDQYLQYEYNSWNTSSVKYLYSWKHRFERFGYRIEIDKGKPISMINTIDFDSLCRKLNIEIKGKFEETTIVDVGSGPSGIGYCLDGYGLKIICIDPLINKYRQLEYYKNNIFNIVDKMENKVLYQAMGEDLPLKNKVADIVFCINVLDHCKNPYLVLDEIQRILKPKGLLILDVDFYYYKKPFIIDIHPSRDTLVVLEEQLSRRFNIISKDLIIKEIPYNKAINKLLLQFQSKKIRMGEMFCILENK